MTTADGGSGGFRYPHPLDPNTVPKGGIEFLGPDTQEKMVQNILAVYDDTAPGMKNAWAREAGKSWYAAARGWTQKILEITGSDVDLDKAVSVLAQLSENKKWPENMKLFMDWIQGKPASELGTFGDTRNVVQRISESDNPLMAGRGQKIYNFLRSILGQDGAVAVDRWATRIALGSSDNPSLHKMSDSLKGRGKYTGPQGGDWSRAFDSMADAYRIAAARRGVPSFVMQAVTWVHPDAGATDQTINSFKETGEWRFPITQEGVANLALQEILENEGVTMDLSGHMPTEGYGYAPKKTTELAIDRGSISDKDLVRYIQEHLKDLKKVGNNLGGWLRTSDNKVVLDVSRVGPASADTIAAAQRASQDAIYDFSAPYEHAEVPVGEMVDGKYVPLGAPDALHVAHQRVLSDLKTTAPEPPPPPPVKAKPGLPRVGRLGEFKIEPDRPGRAGPGSAMRRQPASVPEALGKAGRAAGLIIGGAGDILMAYGLVGQAAERGINAQLQQGNSFAKQGSILGLPYGYGMKGPKTSAHEASTVGRSPAELAYWAKHGHFPDEETAIGSGNGGASFDPNQMQGRQSGGYPGGLQFHSDFSIRHADGSVTRHELVSTPNGYAPRGPVPYGPGDEIHFDGTY